MLLRVFHLSRERSRREGAEDREKTKLTFKKTKTFPSFRGKPCVCGVTELSVDERARTASLGGWTFCEGDWLTLDGTAGSVIRGAELLAPPSVSGGGGDGSGGENGTGSQLATLMRWADERRDLRVLANADTPEDAAVARRNGAEG